VEQRIVIKFLVGENVPSAEIHHRLQQQYGEECLYVQVTVHRDKLRIKQPPRCIKYPTFNFS